MHSFSNLKELLSTLNRGEQLLSEMFKKRKTTDFRYEYALDLEDNDERLIRYLIDRKVIRENGNNLEIDDLYLQFFEQVLAANEKINTAYINENIEKIKQNIEYFFNEENDTRQYRYIRSIKSTLRNIGVITLRNVVDLKRNIDQTYKNEPNFKNKRAKLKNLDAKRKDITNLIDQTENLVHKKEQTFFKTANDEELSRIIVQLKKQLGKATHNLIEIERQIIAFLNQIQEQNSLLEKLRQIKYLKDQFILETLTDIKSILQEKNAVIFEPNPSYPLKLSLHFLQADEAVFESIKKAAQQQQNRLKIKQPVAEGISDELLTTQTEEETQINLEEVKNSYLSGSSELFEFVMQYNFRKKVSFAERVTLYSQLISQYEEKLNLTDEYKTKGNIEYLVVYPE